MSGRALLAVQERNGGAVADVDGCTVDNGQVMGTYMHGLFDTPDLIGHWLKIIGQDGIEIPETGGLAAKMQQYALLAEHFGRHVDVKRIGALVGMEGRLLEK
jgi:adenosylcobyric acid synthase